MSEPINLSAIISVKVGIDETSGAFNVLKSRMRLDYDEQEIADMLVTLNPNREPTVEHITQTAAAAYAIVLRQLNDELRKQLAEAGLVTLQETAATKPPSGELN